MAKRKPKPVHKSPNRVGRPRKGQELLSPELVAAEMVRLFGNVTAVARHFNVTRQSVLGMIRNNENLQEVARSCRETMKDNVESRFYADCLKDEPQYQTSRIFFLKTQAKDRGYIERQQIEHSDATPTAVEEEVIATRTTEGETPTDPPAGPVPR